MQEGLAESSASADESNLQQHTPSATMAISFPAVTARAPAEMISYDAAEILSFDDSWKSKADALIDEISALKTFFGQSAIDEDAMEALFVKTNDELSALRTFFGQIEIDEDAKEALLVKTHEELATQLARSAAAEVKTQRDLENTTEELKSLREMIRCLHTSKDTELEQIQSQFAVDLSLKNAELLSKDAQLKSIDDDLRGLRADIEAEPDEQRFRIATSLSLKSLRGMVVSATERRLVYQELTQGESAEVVAASALKTRMAQEQQLQSHFDASAYAAAESLATQRLQAKEAAVSSNLAASSTAAAAAAELRRKDELMAPAAVAKGRRELESGKQAGHGLDRA
jgi:hypothetical protein